MAKKERKTIIDGDIDIDTALAYCESVELANHDVTGSNLTEEELNEIKRRARETSNRIRQEIHDGRIIVRPKF